MTRKELFAVVVLYGFSFVCSNLSEYFDESFLESEEVNPVEKQAQRLPKYYKCERAYPVKDDIDDPTACSWMVGDNAKVMREIIKFFIVLIFEVQKICFCLKLKGAKWYCLTCKQAKEHPGPSNTNLKCSERRILDQIDGPTKYCVVQVMNQTAQKLIKERKFIFQQKCKSNEDCEYWYADTPFQNCASDGVCEDKHGLDM